MILTHDEIIKCLQDKSIIIDPLDEKRIGPASVDVVLDNQFRIFKANQSEINLNSDTVDTSKATELITTDTITILPGQTILGITKETITLAPHICGWIEGRSRFARIGLMVHISSGFMQPGISNKQVLEIFNAGPMAITVNAGISVCQLIFEEAKGSASYNGQFQHQQTP